MLRPSLNHLRLIAGQPGINHTLQHLDRSLQLLIRYRLNALTLRL